MHEVMGTCQDDPLPDDFDLEKYVDIALSSYDFGPRLCADAAGQDPSAYFMCHLGGPERVVDAVNRPPRVNQPIRHEDAPGRAAEL